MNTDTQKMNKKNQKKTCCQTEKIQPHILYLWSSFEEYLNGFITKSDRKAGKQAVEDGLQLYRAAEDRKQCQFCPQDAKFGEVREFSYKMFGDVPLAKKEFQEGHNDFHESLAHLF